MPTRRLPRDGAIQAAHVDALLDLEGRRFSSESPQYAATLKRGGGGESHPREKRARTMADQKFRGAFAGTGTTFCARAGPTVDFALSAMVKDKIPDLQKLSAAEKLALAYELWEDASCDPDAIPVSEEVLHELDRRHAEYLRDPTQAVSWEAVKAKLLARRP
jgi:putative addiction module component (TIGR02574 family)